MPNYDLEMAESVIAARDLEMEALAAELRDNKDTIDHLDHEMERLSSEGSGYRRALEYIADKDSLDDPRDVAQRTLDAYGERVSLGLAQTDPK